MDALRHRGFAFWWQSNLSLASSRTMRDAGATASTSKTVTDPLGEIGFRPGDVGVAEAVGANEEEPLALDSAREVVRGEVWAAIGCKMGLA
mmetsp:Transcript_8493/g.19988  ORF Transcript_8493/g.19988 Transcript_8493/m.19988 type:complete len:91 (+) Transcript_8493:1244-1516(+)